MKKLLLPLEGTAFRQELLDFAAVLNRQDRILLAAAFVPEVDYAQLWASPAGVMTPYYISKAPDEDKVVTDNGARISDFCKDHGLVCRIHEDRFDFALNAIRKETRFADLVLLSSCHFFEVISSRRPNAYMKEILHHTECPVLLLPEEPKLPGELVLAYDGSASSVFAIRQFAYLFPEFKNVRTTLVYVNDSEGDNVPDESLVRELCEQHFRNFRMLQLHMGKESFYDTWIAMMQDPWLVTGAFGRPEWSEFIRHSFIQELIGEHKVPLFVAHP